MAFYTFESDTDPAYVSDTFNILRDSKDPIKQSLTTSLHGTTEKFDLEVTIQYNLYNLTLCAQHNCVRLQMLLD